jgi:pimeloyl-ACP methyl ester carboxylesterase
MTDTPSPRPDLAWSSRIVAAPDGLRLHLREIAGAASGTLLPVVCLPGLTRSAEDFEIIGLRLAETGRRVIALDSRGRGRSDHDPNWRNYDLKVELMDLLAVLTALGIQRAIFLGTSRGGMLTAMMGLARRDAVAGAILNDIGPVIEAEGLQRIRSYVGKVPVPQSYDEGVVILKQLFAVHFPDEDAETWLRFARRSWELRDGAFVSRYDQNLMKPMEDIDFTQPIPDLWPAFAMLAAAPLLVIRGALSDLLSQATAEEMVRRHPRASLHIVPQQGHAPLLEDEPTIRAILDFVATVT